MGGLARERVAKLRAVHRGGVGAPHIGKRLAGDAAVTKTRPRAEQSLRLLADAQLHTAVVAREQFALAKTLTGERPRALADQARHG